LRFHSGSRTLILSLSNSRQYSQFEDLVGTVHFSYYMHVSLSPAHWLQLRNVVGLVMAMMFTDCSGSGTGFLFF
jgi:hypothetical protein